MRRLGQRVAGGAAVVTAVAAMAVACGTGSGSGAAPAAQAGTGSATVGVLHVTGAYIPQPASPDVAAAYLSIRNTGGSADTLVGVTSPAAGSVVPHDTVGAGAGAGAGAMVPLGRVTVPAHGTLAFSVGAKHLMLMEPRLPALRRGGRTTLTLTFARAGRVTVPVPVTGFTGPDGGSPSTGGMVGPGMPAASP